jgi:hypothetical protein
VSAFDGTSRHTFGSEVILGFVVGARAGRPVTVRLYPLQAEHQLPIIVDLAVFGVAYAVWLGAGLPDRGLAVLPVLGVTALAHAIQLALFVKVRFDDAGITIVRPWSRRRFDWAQVAGLVVTRRHTTTPGPDPYQLRLVLAGHEPPYGRYLTEGERERYARGAPVVMRTNAMPGDPVFRGSQGGRAVACQERVLAELEWHGLPRPAPRPMEFRIRGQDPEQADLAIAADFIRQRDAARNAQDDELA